MAEEGQEQQAEPTDEQYQELEEKFLKGELTEGDVEKESEEETGDESDSTEKKDPPKEEGPAIQENKRLRQKNREFGDEIESLRQQMQELSQKVTQKPEPEEKQDRLKTATVDELLQAEVELEEALLDAYQEGDKGKVKKLSDAKIKVKRELLDRPGKAQEEKQHTDKASAQWTALESAILEARPDITQKDSEIYKKAEAFAKENPELMASLGKNMGALAATAHAIVALNKGTKQGKSATKNIVKEMEQIVETSTSRSGSTSSPKESKSISVESMKDEDIDALWDKIKMGDASLAALA